MVVGSVSERNRILETKPSTKTNPKKKKKKGGMLSPFKKTVIVRDSKEGWSRGKFGKAPSFFAEGGLGVRAQELSIYSRKKGRDSRLAKS